MTDNLMVAGAVDGEGEYLQDDQDDHSIASSLDGGAVAEVNPADDQEDEEEEDQEDGATKGKEKAKRKRIGEKEDTELTWTTGTSLYREQFEHAGKVIPLSKLHIDHSLSHGQTRQIALSHVTKIVDSFTIRPPLDTITALVWHDGGM